VALNYIAPTQRIATFDNDGTLRAIGPTCGAAAAITPVPPAAPKIRRQALDATRAPAPYWYAERSFQLTTIM
jgi:hypothetical protein